jgi:hypothetical protein
MIICVSAQFINGCQKAISCRCHLLVYPGALNRQSLPSFEATMQVSPAGKQDFTGELLMRDKTTLDQQHFIVPGASKFASTIV